LFRARYEENKDYPVIYHSGNCHCKRVKFRIKATSHLKAFDIPSKIRFPQLIIKVENFELLSDDDMLSMYPVYNHPDSSVPTNSNANNLPYNSNDNLTNLTFNNRFNHSSYDNNTSTALVTSDQIKSNNNSNNSSSDSIGIYTFCSFCGVHIIYSPSLEPLEIMVNVDCLDKATINHIEYIYQHIPETQPVMNYQLLSKDINKRGVGIYTNTSNILKSITSKNIMNYTEDETTSESFHSLPGSINELSEANESSKYSYVYDSYNNKYNTSGNIYDDITTTPMHYKLKHHLKHYMPSNDINTNSNTTNNTNDDINESYLAYLS